MANQNTKKRLNKERKSIYNSKKIKTLDTLLKIKIIQTKNTGKAGEE